MEVNCTGNRILTIIYPNFSKEVTEAKNFHSKACCINYMTQLDNMIGSPLSNMHARFNLRKRNGFNCSPSLKRGREDSDRYVAEIFVRESQRAVRLKFINHKNISSNLSDLTNHLDAEKVDRNTENKLYGPKRGAQHVDNSMGLSAKQSNSSRISLRRKLFP